MSAEPQRTLLGRLLRAFGLLAAVAFVALLAYGLVAQAPDTTIDDALARAKATPAPGFALDVLTTGRRGVAARSTLDRAVGDGRVALSELRGAPVVLNFWASWCDPCRVEAPVLEAGWRRASGRGVLFVGLNMQDVPADARDFLQKFRVSYLNVRDRGKEVARRYGGTGIPETYFISARGDVVGHVVGAISPAQLRGGIAAARAGKPTATAEGGDRQQAR